MQTLRHAPPSPKCLGRSHSLLITHQMLGQGEARFGTGRGSARGWHGWGGGKILSFLQGVVWLLGSLCWGTVGVWEGVGRRLWEQFVEGPVGGLFPAGCLMLVL